MADVPSESSLHIAGSIPHSGDMCLLRSVQSCNDGRIVCIADSHRDQGNPLRNARGLPVSAGIEYAAQAMAVHGAARAPASGPPRSGYLAVLSKVQWFRSRLDDLPGELLVSAECLASSDSGSNYRFSVSHEGQTLLQGQAVVALRD